MIRVALLTACAAVAYALGFVLGKVVSVALWLWIAAVNGYKAGL